MLNEEEVKEEIRGLEDLEMETETWGVGKLGNLSATVPPSLSLPKPSPHSITCPTPVLHLFVGRRGKGRPQSAYFGIFWKADHVTAKMQKKRKKMEVPHQWFWSSFGK